MRAAVIFDVDGPLLDLTDAETEAFFAPFEETYGMSGLSRDWDSYRIRNDEEIFREIINGIPGACEAVFPQMLQRYLDKLCALPVMPIPGARDLLSALAAIDGLALGTATANFGAAAQSRLRRAGLWDFVAERHCGAEGGGAKRDILGRAMARLGVAPGRTVFIGDNPTDFEAAQVQGTGFIGFDRDPTRRRRLRDAGAQTVTGDHTETLRLIRAFLAS